MAAVTVADTVRALKGSQPGVKDNYLQNPGWRVQGRGFREVAAGRNSGMASRAQLVEGSLGWLGPHLTRSPWPSLLSGRPAWASAPLAVEVWSIFGYLRPSQASSLNPSCPSSSCASQSMVVFLLVCFRGPGTSCLPRTIPPPPPTSVAVLASPLRPLPCGVAVPLAGPRLNEVPHLDQPGQKQGRSRWGGPPARQVPPLMQPSRTMSWGPPCLESRSLWSADTEKASLIDSRVPGEPERPC